MARDVSEDYYIRPESKIPVKWTAPEVDGQLFHIKYTQNVHRHYTFTSTQFKVMSGALRVYCMRYGVLDIDHLRE